MAGLWRKRFGKLKYLVQRRDGTVPAWPWFVLGGADEASVAALRAYADEAERLNYDPDYVADVRATADDFAAHFEANPPGDPDAGPHRTDDPRIVALMADRLGA